jgi:O-antigen ligase
MLLSPEIPVFHVPDRAVVVRIDDILLIVIFLSWLAKTAINKEFGFLKNTPINMPLFLYAVLCIIATAFAIMLGVGKAIFSNASFYILKYIEYFVIFFLVNNNIKDLKQIKIFTGLILLVCLIIVVYGYFQTFRGVERLSAPFEGEKPEPNTLSGYLVLMFGLMGGLFLESRSLILKLIMSGLFLFTLPVFLFTLSRGGYLGFIVLYLVFIIFNKKARVFLIFTLFILILITPHLLPLRVIERVRETFGTTRRFEVVEYKIGAKRISVEGSAAARIETWKWVIPRWLKSPLFGYGVTGLGFIDGQYLRVLAETGILGLLAFLWLLLRLFRSLSRIYATTTDLWLKGLSLGLLSALAALFIEGWGANVFIIVRIMEPFWFMVGMIIAASQIEESQGAEFVS